MTEVFAPPNLGTLPPVEHVLEELKNEEPLAVDALGNELSDKEREEQMEGLKILEAEFAANEAADATAVEAVTESQSQHDELKEDAVAAVVDGAAEDAAPEEHEAAPEVKESESEDPPAEVETEATEENMNANQEEPSEAETTQDAAQTEAESQVELETAVEESTQEAPVEEDAPSDEGAAPEPEFDSEVKPDVETAEDAVAEAEAETSKAEPEVEEPLLTGNENAPESEAPVVADSYSEGNDKEAPLAEHEHEEEPVHEEVQDDEAAPTTMTESGVEADTEAEGIVEEGPAAEVAEAEVVTELVEEEARPSDDIEVDADAPDVVDAQVEVESSEQEPVMGVEDADPEAQDEEPVAEEIVAAAEENENKAQETAAPQPEAALDEPEVAQESQEINEEEQEVSVEAPADAVEESIESNDETGGQGQGEDVPEASQPGLDATEVDETLAEPVVEEEQQIAVEASAEAETEDTSAPSEEVPEEAPAPADATEERAEVKEEAEEQGEEKAVPEASELEVDAANEDETLAEPAAEAHAIPEEVENIAPVESEVTEEPGVPSEAPAESDLVEETAAPDTSDHVEEEQEVAIEAPVDAVIEDTPHSNEEVPEEAPAPLEGSTELTEAEEAVSEDPQPEVDDETPQEPSAETQAAAQEVEDVAPVETEATNETEAPSEAPEESNLVEETAIQETQTQEINEEEQEITIEASAEAPTEATPEPNDEVLVEVPTPADVPEESSEHNEVEEQEEAVHEASQPELENEMPAEPTDEAHVIPEVVEDVAPVEMEATKESEAPWKTPQGVSESADVQEPEAESVAAASEESTAVLETSPAETTEAEEPEILLETETPVQSDDAPVEQETGPEAVAADEQEPEVEPVPVAAEEESTPVPVAETTEAEIVETPNEPEEPAEEALPEASIEEPDIATSEAAADESIDEKAIEPSEAGIESLSSIPTEITEVPEVASAVEVEEQDLETTAPAAPADVVEESQPVVSEDVEAPNPDDALAETPVPEGSSEEMPAFETAEPIAGSIEDSGLDVKHEEVVPPPVETVPDVQVEVATPASEALSFGSEDENVDKDAPLEQRLAEAAGFGHAVDAISEPLPELEIAAPETTRAIESAEESLATPIASTEPPIESKIINETEAPQEAAAVDEPSVFFTEPAEEPVEDSAHIKKESVDLSTLAFTEPEKEEEVEEDKKSEVEPVDLSTLAFTEPPVEESAASGDAGQSTPSLAIDTAVADAPERPKSPYTPSFSVTKQGTSPIHPPVELQSTEEAVVQEEAPAEDVAEALEEVSENVVVTPPTEEQTATQEVTGDAPVSSADMAVPEEPEDEEPIERGSFIEEKPDLAVDTSVMNQIDRPKSPWTPSFSVSHQGPGIEQEEEAVDDTEDAEEQQQTAAPADAPVASESIEPRTEIERPKSPYPPAYTVTQLGPGIAAEDDIPEDEGSEAPNALSSENSLALHLKMPSLTPESSAESEDFVSTVDSDAPEAPSSPRSNLGSVTPGFDSRSEVSSASHSPIPPDSPRTDPGSAIGLEPETESEVKTPLMKVSEVAQVAMSPLRTPLVLQSTELRDELDHSEKVAAPVTVENEVVEESPVEETVASPSEADRETAFTGSLSELATITDSTRPGSESTMPEISSSAELAVPKLVVPDTKLSAPPVAVVNTFSTDSAYTQMSDTISAGTNVTTPDIGTLDMPKVDTHDGSDVASIEPLDEETDSSTRRPLSSDTSATTRAETNKTLGITHTLAMRSFPSAFSSEAASPSSEQQPQGIPDKPESVKLSPPQERRRLESTTSNLYFPGGWVTSPSQKERPSLEIATGEFSRPILEGSAVASAATAEPEVEESKPEGRGWRCIIM